MIIFKKEEASVSSTIHASVKYSRCWPTCFPAPAKQGTESSSKLLPTFLGSFYAVRQSRPTYVWGPGAQTAESPLFFLFLTPLLYLYWAPPLPPPPRTLNKGRGEHTCSLKVSWKSKESKPSTLFSPGDILTRSHLHQVAALTTKRSIHSIFKNKLQWTRGPKSE